MRVYFILDDTVFFHPEMLDSILKDGRHDWVGIALSSKDVLSGYFRKHIFDIGFTSSARLVRMKYALTLYATLVSPVTKVCVTLNDVAKKHSVPHVHVDNIMCGTFLSHIRSLEPDVIVSSNSQIFGRELLCIPKIACINRHSSLLPSYGGILPVFHAIACGEKEIGVTVHMMDEGIDTGAVISQEAVPIEKGDSLFDLYRKCFDISPRLILEALNILERGVPVSPAFPRRPKSYYSFPTKQQWRLFKQNGGRFM